MYHYSDPVNLVGYLCAHELFECFISYQMLSVNKSKFQPNLSFQILSRSLTTLDIWSLWQLVIMRLLYKLPFPAILPVKQWEDGIHSGLKKETP